MIVSVVNHKGGTGKTTTTINLGSALAAQGFKVLLIDFDAQGSLTYSLGINEYQLTIADALLADCRLSDAIQFREGMAIIPSDTSLADVELTLAKAEDRISHLSSLVTTLHEYDFIFIDCAPSLSLLTLNALIASEYVLIPMQMDVLALRGLDSMLTTVKRIKEINQSLEVLGILPVMIDKRKNIHQEVINHIKANYTERVLEQVIHASVRATEAPSFGTSVIAYAPASSTAQDYLQLAKEVSLLKVRLEEQSTLIN
jgi:chromosome partitioning protein